MQSFVVGQTGYQHDHGTLHVICFFFLTYLMSAINTSFLVLHICLEALCVQNRINKMALTKILVNETGCITIFIYSKWHSASLYSPVIQRYCLGNSRVSCCVVRGLLLCYTSL